VGGCLRKNDQFGRKNLRLEFGLLRKRLSGLLDGAEILFGLVETLIFVVLGFHQEVLMRGSFGGSGDGSRLASESLVRHPGPNGKGHNLSLVMSCGPVGGLAPGLARLTRRLIPWLAQHAADERKQVPQRLAELLGGVIHLRTADGNRKDFKQLRMGQAAALAQHDRANHRTEVFRERRRAVDPLSEVKYVLRRSAPQAGGGKELL